jgi:sugar phosphate isomerase/epimerase
MIKSCVTIARVPEIKKGPWIYWEDFDISFPKAKALGYDAVELFTPSADAAAPEALKKLADDNQIEIAAAGTGAGKVVRGLTLINPDSEIRRQAVEFIGEMIDFGAQFKAPAIIGSMQGIVAPDQEREQALAWLAEGLNQLGKRAEDQGVKLIFEPLNRYETNLFNQTGEAVDFLKILDTGNVTLLADLFHMNIEEVNIADTIRRNADYIGHIHFADSNRRPVGFGHTDMWIKVTFMSFPAQAGNLLVPLRPMYLKDATS